MGDKPRVPLGTLTGNAGVNETQNVFFQFITKDGIVFDIDVVVSLVGPPYYVLNGSMSSGEGLLCTDAGKRWLVTGSVGSGTLLFGTQVPDRPGPGAPPIADMPCAQTILIMATEIVGYNTWKAGYGLDGALPGNGCTLKLKRGDLQIPGNKPGGTVALP